MQAERLRLAVVGLGLVAVLAGAAPASGQAEPGAARTPEITPIKVLRRPTAQETENLYPPEALHRAQMGRAAMTCEVAASTRLERCVITQEDPPGFGFGDALLKTAQYYRVAPPTVDGAPYPGAKITIPMKFELSLDAAARQLDVAKAVEAARARVPLLRAPAVLWVPQAFAILVGLALAWALLWPVAPRRSQRTLRGLWW